MISWIKKIFAPAAPLAPSPMPSLAVAADPDRLYADAYQAMSEGKFIQAEELYRKVLHLAPDRAKAHGQLGYVLWQQERLQEARLALARALALDANYADAHFMLGSIARHAGDSASAITSLRQALSLNADQPFAYR